jgi:hypothetical protein
MWAENTRAFISALPAASKTLFGCPVDRDDGGADRLLELLCDPPAVVRIEGTNRDCPLNRIRDGLSKCHNNHVEGSQY